MSIKSLLTACVAIATSVAAMAAPAVTLTPASGKTFDSVENFASFNLSPSGSYTVNAGATATLECLENAEKFYSTQFRDFMGMAIIINFDTEEITTNGEYELTIPAGSFTVAGEPNEKITATYTLADANLDASEFPQITLVSSTPADGTPIAAIGAKALNKVSFVTSDDDAVNYIGWRIDDITNPENPEYVASGNENRRDLNRNGNNDDIWTNGLYITIGGEDTKLYKGHTYEMSLEFCGIGYDPATNQYPSPTQLENSLELATSIKFTGLTDVTSYSPYTYKSVSPDPENYEIETVEGAMFTITYSGPVKPTSFTYFRGAADTPVAGTYYPVNDEDGDGYADMWEFTVYPELAATLEGTANFYVKTVDADGLFVKGNAEYEMDNFVYNLSYLASVALPDLVSVAPANEAMLESLSEIIVTNSDNLPMAYSYNAAEKARILSMDGQEIRILGEPEAVEGKDTQMKWSFEPITENGAYILMIPKYYFAIGEEFSGTTSKLTSFRYYVQNNQSSEAQFDLTPASVTPADGSTVTEIKEVVIKFADVTYGVDFTNPFATLYKVEGDNETQVAISGQSVENDWYNPTQYTFTFATPVTEAGTYRFKVAKGTLCDEEYDMEMGAAGHANPELVYTYTIGTGSGVNAVASENAVADVFSVDGKVLLRNASAADVKALPAGIYIFNGKKLVVK